MPTCHNQPTPEAPYIVMSSSAQVSASLRKYGGRYENVAVVQTDGTALPKMISANARHLVRIVRYWSACRTGKTDRCQFGQAMIQAQALAAELNAATQA